MPIVGPTAHLCVLLSNTCTLTILRTSLHENRHLESLSENSQILRGISLVSGAVQDLCPSMVRTVVE